MSIVAVARRYAEALADVAVSTNQTAVIDREVKTFAEMLASSNELRGLFTSPIVMQKDKAGILDLLIERTGPGQVTANLLKTLQRHYRLQHLGVVYREFRREMDRREGIMQAEITTAAPMDHSQQSMLVSELQEITGKKVNVEYKVDSSLIGGAVTRLGSVVYDGSIKTKLAAIEQQLKTAE